MITILQGKQVSKVSGSIFSVVTYLVTINLRTQTRQYFQKSHLTKFLHLPIGVPSVNCNFAHCQEAQKMKGVDFILVKRGQ